MELRLAVLQVTHKDFRKERFIWWEKVWYIEIDYVKRALNFISNFNWWLIEIVDKQFTESEYQKKDKYKKPLVDRNGKAVIWKKYDCFVECKFFIKLWWEEITKTVFWTANVYWNIALSKFEAYKIARSNAIKVFAWEFGIWTDVNKNEEERLWMQNRQVELLKAFEIEEWEVVQDSVQQSEEKILDGFDKA